MSIQIEINEDEIFMAIYQYIRRKYPELSPRKGVIYEKTRFRDMRATIQCEYERKK